MLELEKRVVGPGPFEVGDTVDYVYRVTNTGRAQVEDLRVADDKIDGVVCDRSTLAAVTATPANSTECRGRYRVQQSDVEAQGRVVNIATASAEDGGVISASVSASIRIVRPTPTPTSTPTSESPSPSPRDRPDNETEIVENTGELPDSGASPWLTVAGVSGVVLIAGGVGLVLLARSRRT